MTFEVEEKLKPLVDVMEAAGDMAQDIQASLKDQALKKEDKSPVTVCDFAIQAIVAKRLMEVFPQDALVAEEDAADLRKEAFRSTLEEITGLVRRVYPQASPEEVCDWIDHGEGKPGQRFWTLDPIDGTKGFLRGDHFATGLALIEKGEVTLSLMACPTLQRLSGEPAIGAGFFILAQKGNGSWAKPIRAKDSWKALNVSKRKEFAEVILLQSLDKDHHNPTRTQQVYDQLGGQQEILRMDSFAKAVVLAAGEADIFCRMPPKGNEGYRENIWDQAASSFVAQEAGATVTDLEGKKLDFSQGMKLLNNSGILMTNGLIHDRVLQKISEVRKENG